ncbi:hypothetical protein ACFQYP_06120 [Nonomuraea antimicrobica]
MSRLLALGEARAAGVMERLFDDPRLAPEPGSLRPFLRGWGASPAASTSPSAS